jgi:hypothetical protein
MWIVVPHSAKTLLSGNMKKMQNIPHAKRGTITDWSLATLTDTKTLLFGVASWAKGMCLILLSLVMAEQMPSFQLCS